MPNTSEERRAGDPTFNQDLVQHVRGATADEWHRVFLDYRRAAQGRYNVLPAQGWPLKHGADARRKSWAVAMAGASFMHASASRRADEVWDLERTPPAQWQAMGAIATFFESVPELPRMAPRDELAFGQTRWVLADEGRAYVLYAYDAAETLGVKGLTAGDCRLKWLDCASGRTVEEPAARAGGGDTLWRKPAGIGAEAALYVSRVDAPAARPSTPRTRRRASSSASTPAA